LSPIIKETFNRSFSNLSDKLQTGPARRNDKETQKKHLEILTNEEAKVYELLSQSIYKRYNT
jgi:hypothetical protein